MRGTGRRLHHGEAFERGADSAHVLTLETARLEILLKAVGDILVVVRERLDKARGVPRLESVVTLLVRDFHVAGAVAQAHVAPQVASLERLGFQLEPFRAPFAPVHADAQAVAVAESRLAEPDLRAHAVRVLRQRSHVVHDLREQPEGRLVGDDAFGALAGQKVNHVVEVAPEVKRNLGNHRVLEPPALRFGRLASGPQAHEAFLRHFHLHLLDFAELAVGDELLEFAHHRVAGVVVRGAEKSLRLGDGLCDGLALFDARCKRLLAYHGVARLQRVDDDFFVEVSRREHHDGVEPALFQLQQFRVARVRALGRYAPDLGGLLVRLGMRAESARHQLEMPVHLACRLVDFADGRIDTAADKGNLVRFLFHVFEYRII